MDWGAILTMFQVVEQAHRYGPRFAKIEQSALAALDAIEHPQVAKPVKLSEMLDKILPALPNQKE